jgi:hypothetical protein
VLGADDAARLFARGARGARRRPASSCVSHRLDE